MRVTAEWDGQRDRRAGQQPQTLGRIEHFLMDRRHRTALGGGVGGGGSQQKDRPHSL